MKPIKGQPRFLSNSICSSIHPNCQACHSASQEQCQICSNRGEEYSTRKVWRRKKIPKLRKEDLISYSKESSIQEQHFSGGVQIEAQRDKLAIELQLTRQKAQTLESQLIKVRGSLQNKDKAILQKNNEISTLFDQTHSLQSALFQANQETTRLRSSLNACHNNTHSIQSRLQQLERENSKLRPHNNQLIFQLNNAKKLSQAQFHKMQVFFEDKQKHLEQVITNKDRALKDLQQQLKQYQIDHQSIQERKEIKIKNLEQELQKLKAKKHDQITRYNDLSELVKVLKVQLHELEDQKNHLLFERNGNAARLSELQRTATQQQSTIASLQLKNGLFENDFKRKQEQLHYKLQRTAQDSSSHQNTAKRLAEELEQAQKKIFSMHNCMIQLQWHEREANELRIQNQQLRLHLQQIKQQEGLLTRRQNDIRQQLDNSQKNTKHLQYQNQTLKEQANKHSIQLQKKNYKIGLYEQTERRCKDQLAQKQQLVDRLQQQVSTLSHKLDDKKQALHTKQEALGKANQRIQQMSMQANSAQRERSRMTDQLQNLRYQYRQMQRCQADSQQKLLFYTTQYNRKAPEHQQTYLANKALLDRQLDQRHQLKDEIRELKQKQYQLSLETARLEDNNKQATRLHQKQKEEHSRQVVELKGDIERLKQVLSDRNIELASTQAQKINIQDRLKTLVQISHQYELQKVELTTVIDTNNNLKLKLEESAHLLENRKIEINKQQERNRKAAELIADYQIGISQYEQRLRHCQEENKRLQQRFLNFQKEQQTRIKEENFRAMVEAEEQKNKQKMLWYEIQQIRQQCRTHQREAQVSKDKLEGLHSKNKHLVEELSQTNTKNLELTRHLKQKRADCQDKDQKIIDLQESIRTAQSKLATLKDQNYRIKEHSKQLQHQEARHKLQLENALKRGDQAKERARQLARQLEVEHDHLRWNQPRRDVGAGGLSRLTDMVAFQQDEKQSLRKELLRAQQKVGRLQKKNKESENIINELRMTKMLVDNDDQKSQQEQNVNRPTIFKLHQQLAIKREEVRKLRKDLDQLNDKCQQSATQVDQQKSFQGELARLKSQKGQLESGMLHKKNQIFVLQQALAQLKQTCFQHKQLQRQLRDQLSEKQAQIDSLVKQNSRLSRELVANHHLQGADRENERLKQNMRNLKAKHNQEIRDLQERIDQLTLLVQRVEMIHSPSEDDQIRSFGSRGSHQRVQKNLDTFMMKLQDQLQARQDEIKKLRQQYISDKKSLNLSSQQESDLIGQQ